MMHDFAAMLLGPPMKINAEDAHKLAVKWCEWRQYYSSAVDPKTMALGALVVTAVAIEYPRLMMCMAQRDQAKRQKAAAAEARKQAAGNVVPMTDPPIYRGV